MKLGDIIKKILSPIVKGTKFEHCEECEKRRKKINSISDKFVAFLKKVF